MIHHAEHPIGRGTRTRLLEGTLACLRDRGLEGTTSRAIAAASGVNLGGITYHFGSKDDLVAQAMVQAVREWLEPALEALRGPGDPVSRMAGAVQALQASFEQASPKLSVVVEALAQAPRNEAVRREVASLLHDLQRFLAGEIEQLKAGAFLPEWVDPPAMAVLLVSQGEGLAVHTVVDPGGVDHAAVAGQFIQLLLSARATPGPGATA